MGGGKKKTTKVEQTQTNTSTLGSTPVALDGLPEYTAAVKKNIATGPYQGDIVAAPTQASSYAAMPRNISGVVADPGAPLADYTPDVEMLDRYVAGATDGSRDWLASGGQTTMDTAGNMADYWNRVSAGEFLDPGSNVALQNHLNTMSEGALDTFQQGAANFDSEAISSGAYGGTGYGRGMAWGLDELAENDLAQRGELLYRNYGDEMSRIERATGGAQDAFQLGLIPGEVERNFNQFDINDLLARNSERERGEAYDIEDESRRRQDTALRTQAGYDNERGMAQWDIGQQEARIRDEVMRNQVDQQIRQAGITNETSQFDRNQNHETGQWQDFFATLSNPLFGQTSTGQMTGTNTSSESQGIGWQQVVGAVAAVAGVVTANPALVAGGVGMMGSGGDKGGAEPISTGGMSVPAVDYGNRYYSKGNTASSSRPWWLPEVNQYVAPVPSFSNPY